MELQATNYTVDNELNPQKFIPEGDNEIRPDTPSSDKEEKWNPFPLIAFEGRLPKLDEVTGVPAKVLKYYELQHEILSSFKTMSAAMSRMPREINISDITPKGSIISALDQMVVHHNEMDAVIECKNILVASPDNLADTPSIPTLQDSTSGNSNGGLASQNRKTPGGWLRRQLSPRILQTRLAQLTLFCNVCLLVAKAVVVGLSGSLSIISSLLDSCVDLVSGSALWWTSRKMQKINLRTYPQGRTRLEPVVIIILSVIMSVTSFQIIRESIETIIDMTHGKLAPEMGDASIAIACSTVGLKVILWVICEKYGTSSTVAALAQDNRNDVVSNSAALIFSVFSGRVAELIMFHTGKDVIYSNTTMFNNTSGTSRVVHEPGALWLKEFKYLDPIGAIIIALYIIRSWWKTGKEHVRTLTGYIASPEFHQKVCYIAISHHPCILAVDTILAFHFGQNLLVEVDIVLPAQMPLLQAHNIGEALQRKLECLPEVERAFVHLDYETRHRRTYEHKICNV